MNLLKTKKSKNQIKFSKNIKRKIIIISNENNKINKSAKVKMNIKLNN